MADRSLIAVSGAVARVGGHEVDVRGLRLRLGDTIRISGSCDDRVGEIGTGG